MVRYKSIFFPRYCLSFPHQFNSIQYSQPFSQFHSLHTAALSFDSFHSLILYCCINDFTTLFHLQHLAIPPSINTPNQNAFLNHSRSRFRSLHHRRSCCLRQTSSSSQQQDLRRDFHLRRNSWQRRSRSPRRLLGLEPQ